MADKDQTENKWKAIRSWVVGITSVIVVIPALFNAGLDLYNSIMNIPRTHAEKNNAELFTKHFQQEPVVSLPVPVRQGAATYDVRFSIYEEGDVFVEYGDMTQWFPFPNNQSADASSFNLISTAYADNITQVAASYKQTESIDGNYLIRQKEYENGSLEEQVIDMRSGKVVETKQITEKPAVEATPERMRTRLRAEPAPQPAPTQQAISPFAVIDLNAIKAAKSQNATATTCKTSQGNCTLLHAVPTGSNCTCPSSSGELKGSAQ